MLPFLLSVLITLAGAWEPGSRRLLLRDEGRSQLSLVDFGDPQKNWNTPVPPGRDIQLVGNGRVLIGTGTGFEEREILTGKKIFEISSFPGTISARRLRNGNTLLTGVNWQSKEGIVLVEVDDVGKIVTVVAYPGFTYARLTRETPSGTYLITADGLLLEGDKTGKVIWQAKLEGPEKPHAWQALRLANGKTLVSGGYTGNFQLIGSDGKINDVIAGPQEVNSRFYAGFQVLSNGNVVVTNWQGHGPNFGESGVQLLEFNMTGQLVWSWKQDAAQFSSLQGVIVLDGLDVEKLHVEGIDGSLVPVR